ncbi:hypothetical protein EDD15DRAFT_2279370 [Pisolithus albus]|nr:hypothetical protein EDD15DRAFT_2279370 [Pisolithus albus]
MSVFICDYLGSEGFSDENGFSPVALAYARQHFSCTWILRTPYAHPSTTKLLIFCLLKSSTQVNTWDKVNAGMMYKAEVLGKAPVTQHSLFGSTLPY